MGAYLVSLSVATMDISAVDEMVAEKACVMVEVSVAETAGLKDFQKV